VTFSPELLSHLELHQLLSQHAYPFTQKISLLHAGLAQHVDECHSQFLGHPSDFLSSLIWTIAMRTTRWPSASTACRFTPFLGHYPVNVL
jgi:hypothetical protein